MCFVRSYMTILEVLSIFRAIFDFYIGLIVFILEFHIMQMHLN